MKDRFLIVAESFKNRMSEHLLFVLISFLLSCVVALIFFFNSSNLISRDLFNALPLSYTVPNSTYLSIGRSGDIVIIEKQFIEYYDEIYGKDAANVITNDELIALYSKVGEIIERYGVDAKFMNYNLEIDGLICGYRDLDFFDHYGLAIVKFDEDLFQSDQAVIAPLSYGYTLGEEYEIAGESNHRFIIAGLYDDTLKFDFDLSLRPTFFNRSYFFTANDNVTELLISEPSFVGYSYLSNAVYEFDEFEAYQSFTTDLKSIIQEIKEYTMNNNLMTIPLSFTPSVDMQEHQIIDSSTVIYNLVFVSLFIVVAMALYGIMNYIQNTKRSEIFIFYSLGMKKSAIKRYYIISYVLIAALGIAMGIIFGYLTAVFLDTLIANERIDLIHYLNRYAHQISDIDQIDFNLFALSLDSFVLRSLAVYLIVIILLAVSIWHSTSRVLKSTFVKEIR